MKSIIFLLSLLFIIAGADNKPQEFKLPEGRGVNVHHALEEYKVPDASRVLTEQEKHSLCRMFVKAYTMEGKSYSSFPFLTTNAPIYKLLATNFPDIKARAGEGGQLIRIRDIARYFNSLPAYRGDVVKVLEEQKPDASCT
jgi:hypothetical protein